MLDLIGQSILKICLIKEYIKLVNVDKIILSLPLFFFLLYSCQKDYQEDYQAAYDHLSKGEIKDIEKAIDDFDKVILYTMMALDGKSDALRALGHKLVQAEMYLEAANAFEKAREIDPKNVNICYYLGLCYANYAQIEENPPRKKKYIDLAEAAYLSGEKINSENSIILYSLGLLYGFLKADTKMGIKYLRKAVLLEPNNIQVLFALANLHYQMGNIKPARDYYFEILNHVEDDSEYAVNVKKNLETIKRKHQSY